MRKFGWCAVRKDYDDDGYSGGTIDRPGLQRLLDDIRSGQIDVIVVYKIDRLTRSLSDFANMVEVFDTKGVSFVSVTQQFNTTTSMGRLTLNVLLSFAQFEREVTAERIRDKIAASKKKGMWMGGQPPLGFDVKDKNLVINRPEAEQVRQIFEAYVELGSTKAQTAWAKAKGIVTKLRGRPDGSVRCGGRPFSRGNLHALLRYQSYVGEIAHGGNIYRGNHEAILARELWDQVHDKLVASGRGKATKITASRPLTGILFDDTGDRLSPVHAKKQSRRYHYYVSRRLLEVDRSDPTGWRLPAVPLERVIVESVLSLLRKPAAVLEAATGGQSIKNLDAGALNQVLNKANHLIDQIDKLPPSMRLSNLLPLIEKVEIAVGQIVTHLRSKVLADVIGLETAGHLQPREPDATFPLTLPFQLKRRGVEAHFIVTTGLEPNRRVDPNLVRVIGNAWAWFQELSTLPNSSAKAIAARENIPASEVSRQIPLAFLAPDIVSAILNGEQPVDLTAKRLQRMADLPVDWELQARVLGFSKN